MTLASVLYHKKNAWSEDEKLLQQINIYLNNDEMYKAIELLWLLYRDKFIPCEIETDNILLQPLIAAIKNNNEDDIKEEILKLIKYGRRLNIMKTVEFIKDKPYRYISVEQPKFQYSWI